MDNVELQSDRELFYYSPVPLWIEDLSAVKAYIDRLRSSGIRDFRKYFTDNREDAEKCLKMVKTVDVNKYAMECYGIRDKEYISGQLNLFFGETTYNTFTEELIAIAEGKTRFECETITKSLTGSEKHTLLRWIVPPDYEESFSKVLVSTVDLTERRQAEEAAAWEAKINAALVELSKALLKPDKSIGNLSELVLEYAKGLTNSPVGYVGYIDKQTNSFISPTITNEISEIFDIPKGNINFNEFHGLWGWVLENKKPLVSNDPLNDGRSKVSLKKNISLKHFLSVPAMLGKVIVGQVTVGNSAKDYSEKDVQLLERIAVLYAIAIQHLWTEEVITHMAYFDEITNLPNRRLFNDRLYVAISNASRYRKRLAVMFLDLDGFKNVNDSLGHQIGDQLLVEIAYRLSHTVRQSDTIARMGGDEFIVLLTQADHVDNIISVANKILEAVKQPILLDGNEIRITISIGIAQYPDNGKDVNTLLKSADIALYRAKESGKNNYQFSSL
ncbi:MAG: GGDEF domain-containing protein [Candidatus Kuenenia sp.]|nr:GGDEF domain-containing protein [Candidatus Kuenenia hertensis]